MKPEDDIRKEGHTKEWQDRARVVLDAKEAARTEASPKQSPLPGEDDEDVKNRREPDEDDKNDAVY